MVLQSCGWTRCAIGSQLSMLPVNGTPGTCELALVHAEFNFVQRAPIVCSSYVEAVRQKKKPLIIDGLTAEYCRLTADVR